MARQPTSDPSFRPSAVATATATLMVAQQVGGKATRDALFLSTFDASQLPKVMLVAAILSIAAVAALTRLMTRYGPLRAVPLAFLFNGALFGLEFVLAEGAPAATAVGVYLHLAALGSAVISGFWSVVNERFDPHTARRLIGRIAGGATFGGVLGGIAAEGAAAFASMRSMLLVLAAMNALAAVGLRSFGAKSSHETQTKPGDAPSGLSVLERTPYLRDLAWLVGLMAISSAVIDYVFKAEASSSFGSGEPLLSFFALYYTGTSVLTFVVQSLLTRRSLERLGLGPTVSVLPAAVVLASVFGAALTRAWSVTLLRGLSSVLENSLFRSGYELLYTPIAPRDKRSTKAIIDVAFDRIGTAAGSALVLAVLFFGPSGTHGWLLATTAAIAAVASWIALRLHRGYVATLARNLRAGALRLDDTDVVDMTTRRTLADTAVALDRDELLQQIERLRQDLPVAEAARDGAAPAGPLLASRPGEGAAPPREAPIPALVAALTSRDSHRAHPVLTHRPFDAQLTAFAIPLLGDNELARPAIAALRTVAPRVVGQLCDALLDPEQPAIVRRRLPAILTHAPGERAERALTLALMDERFEVRSRAARALSAIQARHGTLTVAESQILEAVRWELDQGESDEIAMASDEDVEDWSPFLHDIVRRRLKRQLEHVFTLLSLVIHRDALTLSLKALFGSDSRLQGTALEYLENVLPGDIRERIWTKLALAPPPSQETRRTRNAIVHELLRSESALEIDLERLRNEPG